MDLDLRNTNPSPDAFARVSRIQVAKKSNCSGMQSKTPISHTVVPRTN